MDFREELLARVEKLPPEMQAQVLRFVDSLAESRPTGESGTALRHFSGSLDPVAAQEIAQAIEEHCERVDAASGKFLLDTNIVIALLRGEEAVLSNLD